ncbi:hypothetical protein [Nocardiopsis halotolerans]|uniref:hypothetical protein n=1 Tax=Nocardiopsis halotolerans TaxID=124252 RepID=UPI0003476AF4|nr:hypothetical protein [Nocardiopsis halotolerans]
MGVIEYGAEIPDIDVDQVAQRVLDKGGADLGEVLQRSWVHDLEPGEPSRWVRLRGTGDQMTLRGRKIDTWPHIPAYLEIEADGRAEVVRVAVYPHHHRRRGMCVKGPRSLRHPGSGPVGSPRREEDHHPCGPGRPATARPHPT